MSGDVDEDEEGDYIDGSCPECGAGPDEQCDRDCSAGADDGEDEDDAFL